MTDISVTSRTERGVLLRACEPQFVAWMLVLIYGIQWWSRVPLSSIDFQEFRPLNTGPIRRADLLTVPVNWRQPSLVVNLANIQADTLLAAVARLCAGIACIKYELCSRIIEIMNGTHRPDGKFMNFGSTISGILVSSIVSKGKKSSFEMQEALPDAIPHPVTTEEIETIAVEFLGDGPSSIPFTIKTFTGSRAQVAIRQTFGPGAARSCNMQTTRRDSKAFPFDTECEAKSKMQAETDDKFQRDVFKTLAEISLWTTTGIRIRTAKTRRINRNHTNVDIHDNYHIKPTEDRTSASVSLISVAGLSKTTTPSPSSFSSKVNGSILLLAHLPTLIRISTYLP
ncbi:hypothetical protein EDD85DRAFT_962940 [Armillaria nabsnona]|nr:hypothetical protein EDD85DRAFT_962940 [Armillaria nabsnona]